MRRKFLLMTFLLAIIGFCGTNLRAQGDLQIATEQELRNFASAVNGGKSYEGKLVTLTDDITLTGEWTPIGDGSRDSKTYTGNSFKGTFDGGDHTISGLTIKSTSGADAAVGLFGIVDGGKVKNLNLTDVNINVASSNLAGAAIGMMLNGATADNITVSGAIIGNDGVGGIVGRLIIYGTISNCINNASVTSAYGGIGGIVGKPYYEDGANTSTFASITNCTNNGTVTAPMYIGGIAGLARANVTDCINNGAVVGGTQTGGIIGQLIAAGTVSGNENKAKISGTNHLGGIIGDYSQSNAYTYYNVSIANNINRGELAATEQCAAIMGCNNIDGFTAMTATGNVSYYYVEGLELFGNPEDMVIDETNKFIIPVAKIGDVEYSTLAKAVAAAETGDEIIMLSDATLDSELTLPAGITFNGNGKQINGNIVAAGDLSFVGHTKVTSFNAGYNKPVITISEGACLEITGTGRMVIGHGCTFNVTGSIEDAKTADKATLTPSLVMPGASFTGAGVTFNVTNAYISAPSSYCSSSSSASGTFDFNIKNSIWESAGKLAFESQSTAATVNFDLVESVLNTGSHLVFGVSRGEVVIDNSNVNVGTSRQIENQSTMTIKNGSVVNGAVATSSNAKNPGTLIVEDATYAVTGEFSGSDLGTGTLIMKNGASFTAGKITKANIQIDATGMAIGDEINLTADLSNHAGTLEVINNDNLDAEIIDGKIVLVEKPVAKIGETEYATLQAALDAAAAGTGNVTVEILRNIDLTGIDWNPVTVSDPGYPSVTVNGNDYTITGLTDMLFAGTWAGNSGLIINDLTIANSTIVNDENDANGNIGVGAFIGFPQASATITLNNCHLVNSTVKGGHWTGGLIGYAAGYAGTDGPVFMELTITGCSVTGSTITGKGSAGGIIGHGSGNAWTNVVIEKTTVSGNTITSTGSSTNKAGAIMGTIGAAGQPTTVNGVTLTGGATVSATVSDNTVKSNGTTITTIYGRQGTPTGMLELAGGSYDKYPIEENVAYAAPAEGYKIEDNGNGTYGVVVDPAYGKVAKVGDVYYETLADAYTAAEDGQTITLLDNITLSEIFVIETSITLDGNNKTLTYTGSDRAIDIYDASNNVDNVTIKNITIKFTSASEYCQRGINYNEGGNLTLDNVTVDGSSVVTYAVNLPSKSTGANVTITNSNITGKIALNVWGANAEINAIDSHFTSVDDVEAENYAAVKLNNNGTDSAEGAEINITGGSITAKDENEQPSSATTNATATGVINISETTEVIGNIVTTVAIVTYEGYSEFYGCSTLQEAIDKAGDDSKATVKLLRNVETSELIKVEKAVVLDLNGKTVTANCKKAFEVYANATIKNGTISSQQRCVDTRTAVELTLENLKLNAIEYYSDWGNQQPLTIGGNDNGTQVTMEDVEINAGTAGYGIITFVETELTANESAISGYNALYVKPGSDNSEFNFYNSDLSGGNIDNDVEGNSFSTIAVRANNVAVNVDAESTVTANGDHYFAISFIGTSENTTTGSSVTVAGEITGNILDDPNSNTVKVKAEYADELAAAGYATIEAENGLVSVIKAVAKIGETLYASLQDAIDAATEDKIIVLENVELENTVTVAAGKVVTLDLNGKNLTGGADVNLVIEGELTIEDNVGNAVSTFRNHYVSNGGKLTLKSGILQNIETNTGGYGIFIERGGESTIEGGTVQAVNESNYAICVNGTLTIVDGNIVGKHGVIAVENPNAIVTIKDGEYTLNAITGNSDHIVYVTAGMINIEGGNFTFNNFANEGDSMIYAAEENVSITGGTYTHDVNEWCAEGYKAVQIDENVYEVRLSSFEKFYTAAGVETTSDDAAYSLSFNVTDYANKELSVKIGNKKPAQNSSINLVTPVTATFDGITFNVTSVANNGFNGTRFKTITISDGVRTLGTKALANMYDLTSVVFPSTLVSVGDNCFHGYGDSHKIKSITSYADEAPVASGNWQTVPFQQCIADVAVLIVPNASSYTEYKESAGWSRFKNIIGIGSTKEIAGKDDKYTLLATVTSMNPMESSIQIGNTKPASNSNAELVLPEVVDYFPSVEGLDFAVTSIPEYAFSSCLYFVGNLVIPQNVRTIGAGAFNTSHLVSNETVRGTLTLNEGLVSIGSQAFKKDYFKGDLSIPSTVKTIASNAFQYASFDGILTINGNIDCANAFGGTGFTELVLVKGVEEIKDSNAFSGMLSLKEVVLPSTLQTVGMAAFKDDDAIEVIHTYATEVPAINSIPGNVNYKYAFSETVKANAVLYVHGTSYDDVLKYKNATNEWKEFQNIHLYGAVATIDEVEYLTIQEAMDAAQNEDVVTIITDVELTTPIVVAADDNFTLNLNGHAVSYTTTEYKGEAMITNNGNLTITDTSDEETGSLSYAYEGGANSSYGFGNSTIENKGVLTINAGTVQNTSEAMSHASYAINTGAGATLNVEGGNILNLNGHAVRMVSFGTELNTVNIEGGYIEGTRALQVQLPGSASSTTKPEMELNITGGELKSNEETYNLAIYVYSNGQSAENVSVEISGGTFNGNVAVNAAATNSMPANAVAITGGTFNGDYGVFSYSDEDAAQAVISITGGTFATNYSEWYAEDDYYVFEENEDGTYTVVEQTIFTQTTQLNTGWNWFSYYVNTDLTALETALGENGVEIKSHLDGYKRYEIYPELNLGFWSGNLSAVAAEQMYMIRTSAQVEDMKLVGEMVDHNNVSITLKPGWNWIGFPMSEAVSVENALNGLSPNSGDIIKSLTNSYAEYTYYETLGIGTWSIALSTLTPGEGYMYYNSSSETKTFTYNVSRSNAELKANVTTDGNHWTPNAGQYPNNMTMTAMVEVEGGDYEVAAFVNGECRGSARPIYIEAMDAHILFLTIHGEDVEEMTFKFNDLATGEEFDLNDRMNYSNDAIVGTIAEPYIFSRGTTGIGEASLSDINIYPNPTTTGTEINLKATCDTVEVFNALGVKVAEYHNVDSLDAFETAGIYVIRITNGGNVKHCSLVVK